MTRKVKVLVSQALTTVNLDALYKDTTSEHYQNDFLLRHFAQEEKIPHCCHFYLQQVNQMWILSNIKHWIFTDRLPILIGSHIRSFQPTNK